MMAEQIFLLLKLASMLSHLEKSEPNKIFFFFFLGSEMASFFWIQFDDSSLSPQAKSEPVIQARPTKYSCSGF